MMMGLDMNSNLALVTILLVFFQGLGFERVHNWVTVGISVFQLSR